MTIGAKTIQQKGCCCLSIVATLTANIQFMALNYGKTAEKTDKYEGTLKVSSTLKRPRSQSNKLIEKN